MTAITTTVDIAASPEEVWAVLTDVERYSDWNPFIIQASGTIAEGGRLRLRMRPGATDDARVQRFQPTVTDVAPGRVLQWRGSLGVRGIFDGHHRFEVSRAADGGTHLLHAETFTGLLARPLLALIGRATRDGFEAMNAALADEVARRARVASAGGR